MGFLKNQVEYKDRYSGDIKVKEEWSSNAFVVGVIAAILIGIILLAGGCGAAKGLRSPGAGEIGVVRNGGPFDKKDIRQILPPASGLTYTGLYSTVHYYPANQRNYIIAANSQDTPGADEFKTPTKDSVNVGVDAQVYFTLNTEDKQLKAFDNKYGTRTNPYGGDRYFPYEGDKGWQAMLASNLKPVVHNALREEIAQFNCTELNAQCALLKTSSSTVKSVDAADTNVNFTKIQDALKTSLNEDLNQTLGGQYFSIQKVNLTGIKLPDASQTAVDEANAAKAEVSTEKYKAQQAKYKAKATLAQARANKANPWNGLRDVCSASENCILNMGGGGGLNLGFNK